MVGWPFVTERADEQGAGEARSLQLVLSVAEVAHGREEHCWR